MRPLAIASLCVLASCQPKYKLVEQAPEAPPVSDPKGRAPAPLENPNPPGVAEKSQYASVDWRVLRGLNTRTGDASAALKKLEGGTVKLTGYMVPFADEYESTNEFLLVPAAGMCIHTPPPPANQIVFVQMTGSPARVTFAKPVAVSGIMSITQSDSPYGKVGFKIEAVDAKEDSSGTY